MVTIRISHKTNDQVIFIFIFERNLYFKNLAFLFIY